MRRTRLFCLLSLGLALACRTSSLGACASDTECVQGSRCDSTQSPPVCVVTQGDCFPSCPGGKTCQAGSCVNPSCNPPCDLSHACDPATLACVPITAPQIAITSPAAQSYATAGTLQATATARAPGGVLSVRFQLSTPAGLALSSAAATAAPTVADPANWAATISLAGVPDGLAQLVATASYGAAGQSLASGPLLLKVDTHAPVLTLATDGRSRTYASGQTAQIVATIDDGSGSGVDPATVFLTLGGVTHAPYLGALASGQITFSVPIDDSVLAAASSAAFSLRIAAKDKAGNSAALEGVPGEVLRADRDAPRIAQIAIATPADYVDPGSGRSYYLNDAGPLSVTAEITDFAGVDPAFVCLHASGEDAGCAHPGSSADGGFWSFTLPRPPLSAQDDGSLPTQLSISAQDTLAAALSSGIAEHQSLGDAGTIYFDNLGPSIQIATDPLPYARAPANILSVQAMIRAPLGLAGTPKLVSKGSAQPAYSSAGGGVYLFQLKTTDAPAGAEGNYSFDLTAQDLLGHSTVVSGTRFIDGAAPLLSLKVFEGAEPTGAGVTYPAAVAGTGWTGSLFIYSDKVHVKGTLSDQGGLTGAAAQLHIDGTGLDGGSVKGSPISLGCTDGQTSCNFDVQVALNAAGNGPFDTFNATVLSNGSLLPAGPLTLTIEAQDRAESADGGPAHNAASDPTVANATRFLWQAALPGQVTGLAIHPDGDLIATTINAASDSVYALYPGGAAAGTALNPAQTALHWSAGADAGVAVGAANVALGDVPGQPAIGTGDAATALIYVATKNAAIAAINPDGSMNWHADGLDAFSVGPAVGTASIGGIPVEQVFVPSKTQPLLYAAIVGGLSTSAAAGDLDASSSPLLLGGAVFFGDSSGVSSVPWGDGTLGNLTHDQQVAGPYFDLISDGTNLFGSTFATKNRLTWSFTQTFGQNWQTATPVPNQSPILARQGLLTSDAGSSKLYLLNPANKAVLGSVDFVSNRALVPLQGSSGRVFVPRTSAVLLTFESNGTAAIIPWYFDPPGNIFRGLQLDCAGRLFLATDNTVYALITDDKGLLDTPWPNYRRDGRNTGNASALKYGINAGAGSCTP